MEHMTSKKLSLLALGMVLLGAVLVILSLRQTIPVQVDGETRLVQSSALTVGGVLRDAKINITENDHVSPPPGQWLGFGPTSIQVERARMILIQAEPGGNQQTFNTPERMIGNLLTTAGMTLYPEDRILLNGEIISANTVLPRESSLVVQVRKAIPITLFEDGGKRVLYSSADSLAPALLGAGLALSPADDLSLPADTPLTAPLEVTLRRAVPIRVQADGVETLIYSAAQTVGQALADGGIALQGLDQSVPAENEPLPADGFIKVVRIREEILLEQAAIPYEVSYVADGELELDQRRVVEAGQPGILATRVRVRYEDGQEVSRETEAEWVARQPTTQTVAYGTKIVVRTITTSEGTFEYWRAVNVYATSYHPCENGTCSYTTASGTTLRNGVIAVRLKWFRSMVGQQMLVPGYGVGTIEDVGGGFPDRHWIDLGYTDEDYREWHSYVTVYWLTPVPANILWILP